MPPPPADSRPSHPQPEQGDELISNTQFERGIEYLSSTWSHYQ